VEMSSSNGTAPVLSGSVQVCTIGQLEGSGSATTLNILLEKQNLVVVLPVGFAYLLCDREQICLRSGL